MALKQCIKCQRVFAANLKFCRFDGSPLVNEVAPPDQGATILFTSEELTGLFSTLEELRHSNGSGKLCE